MFVSHEHPGFLHKKQKRGKLSCLGFDHERWSHCPQRSPGHFSTVPLLQATLDENITPKKKGP